MSIMYDELNEAPAVTRKAIENCASVSKRIAEHCSERNLKRVVVAGRGSSLNAGVAFKFFLEIQTPYIVCLEFPSIVNLYRAERDLTDALYIVVSQSGASEDTLNLARAALKSGAALVSVTNGADNPLASLADFKLDISCGKETAVAATKTLTGELIALQTLAAAFCGKKLGWDFAQEGLRFVLASPPPQLPPVLKRAEQFIVLSRGLTEPIAKECALKLTETCYTFTFSSSTNEFQHGPKALVAPQTAAILFAPSGRCGEDFISAASALKKDGAYLAAFTDMPEIARIADYTVKMPTVDEAETAVVYLVKMQQFVATLCEEKGLSADAPRNLSKITLTR